MAKAADWAKRFTRSTIRDAISNLVWANWPLWGAPVVSAILFYLNGYPVGVVFLSALVALAAVAVGLNNISQWITRRSPAGKLGFAGLAVSIVRDETVTPPLFRGLKFGAQLANSAEVPIDIRFEEFHTQLDNIVPKEKFVPVLLHAGGGKGFATNSGSLIDLTKVDRVNATLLGEMRFKISYGRPNRLRHLLEQTVYVAVQFDGNGEFVRAEWSLTEMSTK
jgi:hypothetical protein